MSQLNYTKVNTDDCWLWAGHKDKNGYGHLKVNHQYLLAHRWFYQAVVGPVPADMPLDHLCRVPACINPAHLEPVTTQINVLRGIGPAAINARRIRCINGHEFTVANTRWRKSGGRTCKACENKRSLAGYYKRRGKLLA